MSKLYDLHRDGGFDLLVLDTPPSRNALDFLDAPDRLTRFLEGRALQVFLRPTGLATRVRGARHGAGVLGAAAGDRSRPARGRVGVLRRAGRAARRLPRARRRRRGAAGRPRHGVPAGQPRPSASPSRRRCSSAAGCAARLPIGRGDRQPRPPPAPRAIARGRGRSGRRWARSWRGGRRQLARPPAAGSPRRRAASRASPGSWERRVLELPHLGHDVHDLEGLARSAASCSPRRPSEPSSAAERRPRSVGSASRGPAPAGAPRWPRRRLAGHRVGQELVGHRHELRLEVPAEDVAQQRAQVVGDLVDQVRRACGSAGASPATTARSSEIAWAVRSASAARSSARAQIAARRWARRPLDGPSGSSSARSASRWSVSACAGVRRGRSRPRSGVSAQASLRRGRRRRALGRQVAESAQLVLLVGLDQHRVDAAVLPPRRLRPRHAAARRRRRCAPSPASRARTSRRRPGAARSAARRSAGARACTAASASPASVSVRSASTFGSSRCPCAPPDGLGRRRPRGVAARPGSLAVERQLLGGERQAVHRRDHRGQRAPLVDRGLQLGVGALEALGRRTRSRCGRRGARSGRPQGRTRPGRRASPATRGSPRRRR